MDRVPTDRNLTRKGRFIGVGVIAALVLTMTLAVAPASATVILSSSNPGNWWQNDTATQPSHRCIYKVFYSLGEYQRLIKMKVWPPHVQAKLAGTELRWHFKVRRQPTSGPQITVYTSPWQTQVRPNGSWATSFTPATWNAPFISPAAPDVNFYSWVEIQWRNASTHQVTGSVTYRLEQYREMWTNSNSQYINPSPCIGAEYVA